MGLVSSVALRYLRSRKTQHFLSFFSVVSFLGIFISVLSFTVIHSVMNGFSIHLRQTLVAVESHVTLEPQDDEWADTIGWLGQNSQVENFQVVMDLDGILETPLGEMTGVRIRGVDAKHSSPILKFYGFEENPSGEGLYLGDEVYKKLKFIPGEQEKVNLIYPFGDVGPTGEIEPRQRSFQVSGIVSSGFYQFDSTTVVAPLDEVIWLGGITNHRQIQVNLKNPDQSQKFIASLHLLHPHLKISTWSEKNKRLVDALALEKMGMGLLLSFVVLLASFNLLGLMTLFTQAKMTESAILTVLGASKSEITKIFAFIGGLLGLVGALLGLGVGLVIVTFLAHYPIPLPSAYYLDFLPAQANPVAILGILCLALLLSLLASLWPALQIRIHRLSDLLRGGGS